MATGGPRLVVRNNNQPKDGGSNGRNDVVDARPGWKVCGWCYFFVRGGKLNNEKLQKIKYNVVLDGHRLIFYMQQPTKNMWDRMRDRAAMLGEGNSIVLGVIELGGGKKLK